MTGGVDGNAVNGVTVNLYASDRTTLLGTTTTDANGSYTFTEIIPGDYIVAIVPLSNYSVVSSTEAASPLDGRTAVTITGVNNSTAIDFGINLPPVAVEDNLGIYDVFSNNGVVSYNPLTNDTDPNNGQIPSDRFSFVPHTLSHITG